VKWNRAAFVVLIIGLVLLAAAGTTFGADPSPTPIVAFDPRSGPMPSVTGSPTLAAILVILLGVITATITGLVVKLLPHHG